MNPRIPQARIKTMTNPKILYVSSPAQVTNATGNDPNITIIKNSSNKTESVRYTGPPYFLVRDELDLGILDIKTQLNRKRKGKWQ